MLGDRMSTVPKFILTPVFRTLTKPRYSEWIFLRAIFGSRNYLEGNYLKRRMGFSIRGLPLMMSTKISDFVTPSTLVRIWIWFII